MKESLRVFAGKHRFVRHCLFSLFLMGLFVQCQRTETEPQPPKIIDDHEAIDQAKKWFDANLQPNAAAGRQVISKKTVWEKAFTVRGQVVVPLLYDDTLSARRGYNRLFLTPDKDGKYKSKIIRFVPLGDYLEKNGFKIREEDFTGLVFAYGWDESFTGGWLSSGGKITGTVGDKEASPSGRTQACVTYSVDWFQKVTVGGSTATSYLDTQYHTYCTTTQTFPKVTDVLGYSGGGGGTTTGGTGTGSSYEEALPCEGEYTGRDGTCRTTAWQIAVLRQPNRVINNLTRPCLSNTLNLLLNKSLKERVNFILNRIFNTNDKTNITFRENASLPYTTDGQVNNELTRVGYGVGGVTADVVIDINPTALQNATQQYITVTILHETLHGYMKVRKAQLAYQGYGTSTPEVGQHATMAASYVSELKSAILEVFPSYPPDWAESIAWGGLEGTAAYQSYANLPGWHDRTAAINVAEKGVPGAGTPRGTKCP